MINNKRVDVLVSMRNQNRSERERELPSGLATTSTAVVNVDISNAFTLIDFRETSRGILLYP